MKLTNEELALRLGQITVTCTRAIVESLGDMLGSPSHGINLVNQAQEMVNDLSLAAQMEEPKREEKKYETSEPYTTEDIEWYIKVLPWGGANLKSHAEAVLRDFRHSIIQRRSGI